MRVTVVSVSTALFLRAHRYAGCKTAATVYSGTFLAFAILLDLLRQYASSMRCNHIDCWPEATRRPADRVHDGSIPLWTIGVLRFLSCLLAERFGPVRKCALPLALLFALPDLETKEWVNGSLHTTEGLNLAGIRSSASFRGGDVSRSPFLNLLLRAFGQALTTSSETDTHCANHKNRGQAT